MEFYSQIYQIEVQLIIYCWQVKPLFHLQGEVVAFLNGTRSNGFYLLIHYLHLFCLSHISCKLNHDIYIVIHYYRKGWLPRLLYASVFATLSFICAAILRCCSWYLIAFVYSPRDSWDRPRLPYARPEIGHSKNTQTDDLKHFQQTSTINQDAVFKNRGKLTVTGTK